MTRSERLVKRYVERWAYLLGLGAWRITWEVTEKPLVHAGEEVAAVSDYERKRSGYQWARLRFYGPELTTPAKVEATVIHELLHLFDRGIGNDAHKLIYRLERPLRMVRQRASR